ncbi:MAG: hypothetical protein ACREJG_11205 [Candidatus Rokuibacteriota bacterium]
MDNIAFAKLVGLGVVFVIFVVTVLLMPRIFGVTPPPETDDAAVPQPPIPPPETATKVVPRAVEATQDPLVARNKVP